MDKTRNYSLDILKIIAIFFVIVLHYNNGGMGGMLANVQKGTFNYFFAHFTEILTITACNIFVLVSGYFLSTSNKIKVRKIVDIILLLIFYGIIVYIISIITGLTTFNRQTFKQMLLTIDDRWFINIYILLYILHPFINKIINNISKKQFTGLIIICIFFFSIWSSILKPSGVLNINSYVNDGGYGITNFIMLYLIGAFIRKYYCNIKVNKIILIIAYIVLALIGTLIFNEYPNAINYNFIINVINSIIMFLIFKQIDIHKGKWISKVSGCSLAIYIIHENMFIRKYLFVDVFKEQLFYNNHWVILHQFGTCVGIFCICLAIEIIRKFLFKITLDKLLDKIKIVNKIIEI